MYSTKRFEMKSTNPFDFILARFDGFFGIKKNKRLY